MGDGVAGDAKDAGCLVELVKAVEVEQGARGDLAGRGLCGFENEAKVKAPPARGPSTRDKMPSSPMAMPTTCAESELVFNELEYGEIIGEGFGGGDDLDEIRGEGGDALGSLFEALGASKVVEADKEGCACGTMPSRKRASCAGLASSADSTSRSTMAQPASAALSNISNSEVKDPTKLPPLGLRRQVAMAVTFAVGGEELGRQRQAGGGLGERIEAEFEKGGVPQAARRRAPSFLQEWRPGWPRTACPGAGREAPAAGASGGALGVVRAIAIN